ncbi:MAG: outer membrane protein assembly factor BamB [Gammaproteobacteria bacterium]|jgi:outer membrane protein assembly factor BamB
MKLNFPSVFTVRVLLGASLIVILAACGSPDNSEPPAPLTDINNGLRFDQIWTIKTGAGISAGSYNRQPLLVGDEIFTVDIDGLIKNIDAESGKLKWDFETGIESITGLFGNNKIIVASSRNGELNIYDRTDNNLNLRWSARLKGEIRSAPVTNADSLFIRTVDGRLSSISKADGSIQWTVSHLVPALSLTGNSAPILHNELVIAGFDDGKLAAFDQTNGQVVWEITVSQPTGRSEIERLVDVDGQFILSDGVIYVSSYQGRIAAIQAIDGEELWSRKFSSFNAMSIDADAIYISSDSSHLWSIDRRTGSALWKQDILHARKISAPLLFKDKIIVGDFDGHVHWFNQSDGALIGRLRPSYKRHYSRPFQWDNKIFAMDSDGILSSFEVIQ